MPRKSKTDHCVMRNGKPFCENCGGTYDLRLPMPAETLPKVLNAFIALHKFCTEKTWVEPVADQSGTVRDKALFWLTNGRRGISSETMFNVFAEKEGIAPIVSRWPGSHPHDPDDFNRCHLLLETVPEWRERLDELRVLGDPWPALVENWDKLTEMLEDNIKNGANGMYEFMKELGC